MIVDPVTRKAMAISWLLVSIAIGIILVLPLVLSAETIHGLLPPCESRTHFARPCSACGLTTGFIALSQLDFAGARAANAASPIVYGLFILNSLAFLATAIHLGRKSLHANR